MKVIYDAFRNTYTSPTLLSLIHDFAILELDFKSLWWQFTHQRPYCSLPCWNHYSIILIKFKPHLNLNLDTWIHLLQPPFPAYVSNKPAGTIIPPYFIPLNFESLLKNIYLCVFQPLSHIQSIISKVNIMLPLRWYYLLPYLTTSQMIIIGFMIVPSLLLVSIIGTFTSNWIFSAIVSKSFFSMYLLFLPKLNSLKVIHLWMMKFDFLGFNSHNP